MSRPTCIRFEKWVQFSALLMVLLIESAISIGSLKNGRSSNDSNASNILTSNDDVPHSPSSGEKIGKKLKVERATAQEHRLIVAGIPDISRFPVERATAQEHRLIVAGIPDISRISLACIHTVERATAQEHRLIVAGIPDISRLMFFYETDRPFELKKTQLSLGINSIAADPCFRRYANCIIVNAQPYERRSSTSLSRCKSHCLNSQTGVYSCRSFIFDNINQICDLFSHYGDQAPARLLKFQSRDYFEPTHAVQCLNFVETRTQLASIITRQHTTRLPTRSTNRDDTRQLKLKDQVELKAIMKLADVADFNYQNPSMTCPVGKKISLLRHGILQYSSFLRTEGFVLYNNDDLTMKVSDVSECVLACNLNKYSSFLRTEGFVLYNNDDLTMKVSDVSECVLACNLNKISGNALDCRSFDYTPPLCSFSSESSVPLGSGQLKQRNGSFYYEKTCRLTRRTLDPLRTLLFRAHEKLLASPLKTCSPTITRFPQMVLVGFAESVSDTSSFEACLDNCLDSQRKFGFDCISGMYFFEESQLNCILNSEDRHTQSDLFAEENMDIVDYFEIDCDESIRKKQHDDFKTHGKQPFHHH
ncbi:PAN domain protein [Dictyocaulus viviparus]|uniref:PAN domain protein n=1 Tax=Dictyocaulus viviparus TaxID=29172 RepID=A0A0D8Y7C0_DICVI|nr:PAN domain protein [Dictyocaulus viviparus]